MNYFSVVILFSIAYAGILAGCSNTASGVIEEEVPYRSIKSTSGATAEGCYTIEIGESVNSGTIKRALSFCLIKPDGEHCAFSIIRKTENGKKKYQALIAVGRQAVIPETIYSSYSVTGTTGGCGRKYTLSDIKISSDAVPAADGYYYWSLLGTLSETAYEALKTQPNLTVGLSGKQTVLFTVPYDFLYGMSAYL